MTTNLFALCRSNGQLQVKRVSLVQEVQEKLAGLFQAQANTFMDGVSEEIKFEGDWKPDADEILVIDAPQEVSLIETAIAANITSLPAIQEISSVKASKRSLSQSRTAQVPEFSFSFLARSRYLRGVFHYCWTAIRSRN